MSKIINIIANIISGGGITGPPTPASTNIISETGDQLLSETGDTLITEA